MLNPFYRSHEFTAQGSARPCRIERKMDLILGHLGVAFTDVDGGLPGTARVLAGRGDKIGAIKAYRDSTGAGLAEAKRAIESYLSHTGRTA